MGYIEAIELEEIGFDPNNTNLHTERGEFQLRQSMERWGFAAAGTLDANNNLNSGS